jgi:hypothetical protein
MGGRGKCGEAAFSPPSKKIRIRWLSAVEAKFGLFHPTARKAYIQKKKKATLKSLFLLIKT